MEEIGAGEAGEVALDDIDHAGEATAQGVLLETGKALGLRRFVHRFAAGLHHRRQPRP
jgi:hypothetical protein